MQYSLTRNEKTHLLWKFVRDLTDLSSDLKQNCVLHIIAKHLRFSMISIEMVHIYCKYWKNAFKHGKNVQKVRRVYEQLRCVYELTYAPFMSSYAGLRFIPPCVFIRSKNISIHQILFKGRGIKNLSIYVSDVWKGS